MSKVSEIGSEVNFDSDFNSILENKTRCAWANANEIEKIYHDTEWGVLVHDDRVLFEMLTLEGAQAGLSWKTALNKRQGYRLAFDNFDIQKVVIYGQEKILELIHNPEIIRNKLKIHSTVENAQAILRVQAEYGSFDSYIWLFVNNKSVQNSRKNMSEMPSSRQISDKMSKELKKKGFKFVGSTICYAFMQAVGMVNDHTVDCFRYSE